jgi:hypothetical protein
LPEWDAHDNLVPGDAKNLLAGLLDFGNVLQYLRAEYAVKRLVRKVEPGYVSRDSDDAGDLEAGFLKIERGHFGEILCQ